MKNASGLPSSIGAIDALLSTLMRLKESGGAMNIDDLWNQTLDTTTQEIDVGGRIASIRAHIVGLEDVIRVLDSLRNSSTQKIEALSKQIIRTSRANLEPTRISSLPDEVLEIIFEETQYSREEERKLRRLGIAAMNVVVSHVCKRFRKVAIHRARLWTLLSNKHGKEELHTRLLRSRGLGLAVEVSSHKWNNNLERFLDIVLPLSERWDEFHFSADDGCEVDYLDGLNEGLIRTTSHLRLPSLRTLVLQEDLCDDVPPYDDTNFDFYYSWQLPCLTQMKLRDHIPPPAHFHEQRNLVSLSFSATIGEGDIRCMIRFLNTTPKLTHLKLKFEDLYVWLPDKNTERLPVVTLSELTTLDILYVRASFSDLQRLSQHLLAPNLSKLTLELPGIAPVTRKEETREDIELILYDIITKGGFGRPNITDLSLTLNKSSLMGGAMDAIFNQYTGLKHLSIEAPDLRPPDFNGIGTLPPLRTLRLKNCFRLGKEFIDDLEEVMQETSTIENFERLDVIQSMGLGLEDFESSNLGDRLEYVVTDESPLYDDWWDEIMGLCIFDESDRLESLNA